MTRAQRSKLLPLGFALMILGMAFSRGLATFGQGLNDATYRGIVMILTDLMRLCFFLGLVFGILGFLRNRRATRRYVRNGAGSDGKS